MGLRDVEEQVQEPVVAPAPVTPHAAAPPAARVLALQQTAGNQAVGRLLQRNGPTAAADPTAATEPFELGGMHIATYGEGALALMKWCLDLEAESKALQEGNIAVPQALEKTLEAGRKHKDLLVGGETEALDRGNADDMRAWYADYVKAVNLSRAEQAGEAAQRARRAADELEKAQAELEKLEPAMRDVQRAKFRGGDEDGLLATADAIAGVVDTGLVAKGAIDSTIEFAEEMRAIVGRGPGSTVPIEIASKVQVTLDVIEKINKAYAAFQLMRAGVDLMTGSKTEGEAGRKGVAAMATVVSAGGTLLNASAGFTLYANLYIGPMVGACLSMLSKIEDLLSKGSNRQAIELGRPDWVNWSLEPGGRPMFDFMLVVMKATGPEGIPTPPAAVDEYFVDNDDDFSAGVGKKGGELPTEGFWLWEETDKGKIKSWCFKNRKDLWGMLYGAAAVPTGRQL